MVTKTVGEMSCVGILNPTFPLSFGNYFNFRSGERCLNMWAENFKEFVDRNEILEIACTVFSDGKTRLAFVTDKRVPPEWLHGDMCVTGCGWGSRELCESCCGFQGASTENKVCGCEKLDHSGRLGGTVPECW